LSVSYEQVDAFCKSEGKLKVVGYYHANERLNELDLKPAARKIADKIQQQTTQAVTLLVTLQGSILLFYLFLCLAQSKVQDKVHDAELCVQLDNSKLPALTNHQSADIMQVP